VISSTRNGKILILLFLVFTFCSKPPLWRAEKIKAKSKEHQALRYLYIPTKPNARFQVQIVKAEYGVRFSLHLLSLPTSENRRWTDKVKINIETEDARQDFLAERLEGGQVILMPEQKGAFLLALLQQGEPLSITLPGYQISIPPIDKLP
jgi:hypothetical protein